MDHAHFGLEKSLFGDGIAADSAVFRSPKHDQLIANFKLALGSPSSAIVLGGAAGVGKTTLTSAALRASSTRLALAWLNGTPTNAAELLELVLVELGIGTARTTRIERLQLWRQFQAETRATESRLFVVVERTEDFSLEVLHALDALTAADAAGNLGANVVLLGHADVHEHLAAPLLDSLHQRIRLRAELAPFTEAELQDFLRHQVACAGGHYDRMFAPGAVAVLYRRSAGVARLARNLCETALDYAAGQKKTILTPELIDHTAVALLGLGSAAVAARTEPAATASPVEASAPPPLVSVPSVAVALAPFPAQTALIPAAPPVATSSAAVPTAAVAPAPARATAAPSVATAVTAAAPATPIVVPAPAVGEPPTVPSPAVAAPAPRVAAPIFATPAPAPAPVPFEYDGGATDIADVAAMDFPVLTDAVDPVEAAPLVKATSVAPPPPAPKTELTPPPAKPAPAPAPMARAPAATAVAPPAPPPKQAATSRIETAYAPKPAAPKPAPATPGPAAAAPAPLAAAAKPSAPTPATQLSTADPEADDVLRQTQTMRAISVAKSIDDISSSMAETLFGDAELDLMTAALASAAGWPPDEAAAPPAGKPAPAAAKPEPPAPPEPLDDPFDLFGLGDDAPLELIDDSTLPPIDKARKTASR